VDKPLYNYGYFFVHDLENGRQQTTQPGDPYFYGATVSEFLLEFFILLFQDDRCRIGRYCFFVGYNCFSVVSFSQIKTMGSVCQYTLLIVGYICDSSEHCIFASERKLININKQNKFGPNKFS
jgi:membrane-associated PAP2 superfamily phosphatase